MKLSRKDVEFVISFFNRLNAEHIKYCILRNENEILNGHCHDIDMVISENSIPYIYKVFFEVGNGKWKIHYKALKDNGNLLTVHLYSLEEDTPMLLHFDFFFSFGWDGYRLIENQDLLANRNQYQGLYVASDCIKAVTMLFSRYLYHGYIKENYREYIQQVFKTNTVDVQKLMQSFLSTQLSEAIVKDVELGEWNNIEKEWYTVKQNVKMQVSQRQKRVPLQMKLFNLKRVLKYTGIVVQCPPNSTKEECSLFSKGIQEMLSRTFSVEDIIYKFVDRGDSLKIRDYIKIKIALSKGRIIFSNRQISSDAVKVSCINKMISEQVSCEILEHMSRRY